MEPKILEISATTVRGRMHVAIRCDDNRVRVYNPRDQRWVTLPLIPENGAEAPPRVGVPKSGSPALYAALSGARRCLNCDSDQLKWFSHVRNAGGVHDGRIRMHEVVPEFVLGCVECSETVLVVPGEDVAALLNTVQAEAIALTRKTHER